MVGILANTVAWLLKDSRLDEQRKRTASAKAATERYCQLTLRYEQLAQSYQQQAERHREHRERMDRLIERYEAITESLIKRLEESSRDERDTRPSNAG